MADEEVVVAEAQEEAPKADEEKKDRWDELMAKLDDITETLRKACEGGSEEEEKGEGTPVAEEQQEQAKEGEDVQAEDEKPKGKKADNKKAEGEKPKDQK